MTLLVHETDEVLVRSVLSGSTDRFEVLIERHLAKVYAIVHAHLGLDADIDDVTQDAFVAAFRSLDKLRNPAQFGFWLSAIARNGAKRRIRDKVRARKTHDEYGEQAVDSVFNDPMETERYRIVAEAVDALGDDHREALLLFYYAGMSTTDMALDLGVSQEVAKKRLQRAREALGVKLAGQAKELLQTRVPSGAQATRIALAIAGTSPAWLAAASGGGTISAATLLGGSLMTTKTLLVLGVLTAIAGASTFMVKPGEAAPPAPEPEVPVVVAESPVAPDPEAPVPEVAETPPEEPAPQDEASEAPKPEAAPARAAAANRVPTYRVKQSTMAGGNAQRTGFYNVSAPLKKPTQRWSIPLGLPGGYPGVMPTVALDGSILADYGKRGENFFGRFSAKGELLWEVGPFDGKRSLGTPTMLSDGTIVHAFNPTTELMAAYEPLTGAERWKLEGVHARHEAPTVDSRDNLYIAAQGPAGLARIDGDTGELIWPKDPSPDADMFNANASPSLSVDESTLYAGVRPGTVSNRSSGQEVLERIPGRILAVSANDGKVKWSYDPNDDPGPPPEHPFDPNWGPPIVGQDSTLYFQDAGSGKLIALVDGGSSVSVRWAYDPRWAGDVPRFEERDDSRYVFETPYNSHDTPRMTATDGTSVYLGNWGYPASVHAVNVEDGTAVWRTALEGNPVIGTPTVTPDAVYILASGDDEIEGTNALFCLDRKSGEILWEYPVAGPHGDTGEAIGLGPDGTIYVMSSGLDGDQCVLMALR
jgi:RNA polymerase sigma-70 factor (ECF subfamily)